MNYSEYLNPAAVLSSTAAVRHNWNWDSGFIAIGYAHYDVNKAKREIEALLSAQWENGFIPHIVFHNDSDTYFPGPDFHLSKLHPLASKSHRTTGMTQPPVLGFVLKEIYDIIGLTKFT